MSAPLPADRVSVALHSCDAETATTEVRPIVICEECGRKYSVSPSKIQGTAAGFTCRHCGHRIVVARTKGLQQVETLPWPAAPAATEAELADVQPLQRSAEPGRRLTLFVVFGVITAAAIAGAAAFFLVRTQGLLEAFERQGREAAQASARERIERIAADAAEQAERLLAILPDLDRRELAHRSELRAIVAPPVGATGQAMLYALPESDGAWRVWLHPDPRLTGAELSALAAHVGPHFPEVWKTLTGVAGGAPTSGHYRVQGAGGEVQVHAMACRPVAGTRFVLAAAAPVEELAASLVGLQKGAVDLIREMGLTAACLLGGTAIALAHMVVLCSFRRARPTKDRSRRRPAKPSEAARRSGGTDNR